MNTNENQLPELPETIGAGDEVEVQIAPFGDLPNVDVDDSPLTQSEMGEEHLKNKTPNFQGISGFLRWCAWRGSNPQPSAPEANALSN